MEAVGNENVGKSGTFFCCNVCDYKTGKKYNFEKHLLTYKHLISINGNKNVGKSSNTNFTCETCNKSYKNSSGLWKHSKKCIKEENKNIVIEELSHGMVSNPLEIITELFQEQLKENKELKELLIEQNKKLIELAEKSQGQITNITNNNSNTNNFNLQVFLNEQCKDALNIMEFINQLQLNTSDLDMVGRVGYAEGISKIFIRGLKELDIFKRPLHCSDLKREVVYVKDKDAWEKDGEDKKTMKNAIKFIAAKNFNMLNDWIEDNPEYNDYDSKKHKEYHNIILKASGGATPEEDEKNYNKIIRNVAQEITIDKSADK
jgi:hypothetical protein